MEIDRRRFLERSGVAGVAAGALWVAPSVLGTSAAFAGASCLQRDTWDWSTFAVGANPGALTLPAVGSYPALTVTKTVTPVGSVTPGAVTRQVVNTPTPLAGVGGSGYRLAFTFPNDTATSGYDVTFTFSSAVSNLKFVVADVDGAPVATFGYIDHVWLTSPSAFSASAAPEVVGSGTAASPWVGTAIVADNTSGANIAVTFATASTFTIHYRGDDTFHGSEQGIFLLNLTWCR